MARLTKHQQGLIDEVFYGINISTHEVERVSRTRANVLQKYNRDMVLTTHAIIGPRQARTEVTVAFDLVDVISFRAGTEDSESAKKEIERLRELAAQRKKDALDENRKD